MASSRATEQEELDAVDEIETLFQDVKRRPESRSQDEETLRAALRLSEQKLGHDHRVTIRAAFELAKFYHHTEDYAMALSTYYRLLVDCLRVFGNSHSITLDTMSMPAAIFYARKQYEDCKDIWHQMFTKYQDANPYGTKTLVCQGFLARVLLELETYDEAEILYFELVQKHRQGASLHFIPGVWAVYGLVRCYHKRTYNLYQGLWKNENEKQKARDYFVECVNLCIEVALTEALGLLGEVLGVVGVMSLYLGEDDTFQTCLWSRDALQWLDSSGRFEWICVRCTEQVSSGGQYACRQCQYINLCSECYIVHQSSNEPGFESCRNHSFYKTRRRGISEVKSGNEAEAVRAWLVGLVEHYTLHNWQSDAMSAGGENMPPNIDEWKARIPMALQIEQSNLLSQELSRSKMADISLAWQKARTRHTKFRVPAMLQHAFRVDGFQPENIHPWCFSDDLTHDSAEILCQAISSIIAQAYPLGMIPGFLEKTPNSLEKISKSVDDLRPHKIYEQFPLGAAKEEIRLLELLPGIGDDIHCTMRTSSLRQEINFDALSYVWGDTATENMPVVIIEGTPFRVTHNLRQALADLREHDRSRSLWVDAICINQEDNSEKAHQIKLMTEIYKRASSVLVYLCAHNDSFTPLFQFFNRNRHLTPRHLDVELRSLGINKWAMLKAAFGFCSTPWWSRLWIRQEYQLATQDPIFHCGRHNTRASSVYYDLMALLPEIIKLAHEFKDTDVVVYFGPQLTDLSDNLVYATRVLNLRCYEDLSVILKAPLSLQFRDTARTQYTNPLDIIYARAAISEPIIGALFPPDYGITEDDLYVKIAAWTLVFDDWETIFWYFPYRRSWNLPSWVPDFSKPREWTIKRQPPTEILEPAQLSPSICKGVLALGGYFVDTIEQSFVSRSSTPFQELGRLWHLDQHLIRHLKPLQVRNMHHLSFVFSRAVSSSSLLSWATWVQFHGTISSMLEQITVFEFRDIIIEIFVQIIEKLDDFCHRQKQNANAAFKVLNEIAAQSDEKSRGPPAESTHQLFWSRHYDYSNQLYTAARGIQIRLMHLGRELVAGDAKYDLLGAALFDHQALLEALYRAQKPQSQGIFDHSHRVLTDLDALLKTLFTCLDHDGNEPLVRPAVPDQCRIGPINYGHISAAIMNCKFDREARLHVALLKTLVTKIRSLFNSNGDRHDPMGSRDGILEPCLREKRKCPTTIEDRERFVLRWLECMGHKQNSNGDPGDDPDVRKAKEFLGEVREELSDFDTDKFEHHDRVLLAPYCAHFLNEVRGKTFFVTKRGLVGCGPPKVTDIRKGDKVIMLQTSHEPFIIRPTDDPKYHTVVGFGKVRGLADGVFHNLPDEKKPEMRIYKFK